MDIKREHKDIREGASLETGQQGMSPMKMAGYCRHYAMCKIDFLETGVCAPGLRHGFVSYYPQGRMDLYAALQRGKVSLTRGAVHIAETCNLCGKCDYQCHFVTEMRPLRVMEALRQYVEANRNHIEEGAAVDAVYEGLAAIVGAEWCSRDPAICVAYSSDPGPATPQTLPSYVALPGNRQEVAAIMKLCQQEGLGFAVRGNGSSVMGFVMSHDLVLDMSRMKKAEVDSGRGLIRLGAGVTAYEAQKKAYEHGCRVQAAEPSAMICANLMCSGIFSTYSHAFGMGAQNVVDAEFVDPHGRIFRLSEKDAPNLFAYQQREVELPGICTEVAYKMYPRLPDERGFLVPFDHFDTALAFIREAGQRRIGLAAGLLGGAYLSTFLTPTSQMAQRIKDVLHRQMGISFLVQMIGDQYNEDAVRKMGYPVISQRIFRTLMLSLPSLGENEVLIHMNEMMPGASFHDLLSDKKMEPLLETILQPDAQSIADAVPGDLSDFYYRLYQDPRMTDLVWLNDFRIISSRMGREKHVVAWIVYVPLDPPGVVKAINADFDAIAAKWNIKHDYGFITPVDFGKRAVFEYDYYLDQQDEDERMRMLQAMKETAGMIGRYAGEYDSVRWIKHTLYQGFARMENLLYT